MGVDYSANYGIGFQVSVDLIRDSDKEEYEGVHGTEILEEVLSGTGYSYFEVGEGSYTGEEDDLYVILKNRNLPHKLVGISEQIDKLKDYLNSKNILILSEGGIVGGLRVW